MNLHLNYFGMIAEKTAITKEMLNAGNDSLSVEDLNKLLCNKYPALKEINYKIAVNQTLADDFLLLNENDEIALLPPFAGG
ncbi:MAG: MoaD/ThiS family protein [Vicingaceae bacterium]|nr:MoaD/ThiS family protein [Vicingaceae bacterium]